MPKDAKPKKDFKAVTEELLPLEEKKEKMSEEVPKDAPQVALQPEPLPETPISGLAVKETNNIDLNSKPSETGAFLKIFLITFFATLLAFLLAGGVYVYLTGTNLSTKRQMSVTNNATPTQIPTSTVIPSASPSANVDLTSFKMSVLNGNGGIGVATAAKTIVEKAGFKVASVGNADNFNFTNTMIQVKPSVSADIVAKLKDALSASYSVKIGNQLDPADTFDIVVTVGSS